MTNAYRDENSIPTLIASSNADGFTPVRVYADPVTHRLLVQAGGGGSGTVTSVSVVTANGFAGTVATATTTPAITLSTTVTAAVLGGNGTAIIAATPGTDYTNLAFKTYSVAGQSDIVADSAEDTFTFVAGTNVTLTTNASTDTLTINATAGASGITIGTTTITSGTDTRILYDNAGVVGEYTLTGTGTVVAMQTSPVFVTAITTPIANLSGTSNQLVFQSAGVTGTVTWTPTSSGKTVTIPDRTLTIDNITTDTTTPGTGFLKGNGSVISFDNSTFISGLVVGTTTIGSGTDTRILYDNSGVLGEYTLTGSGTVVAMQTAPTFVTSITTPAVLATSNDSGAIGASGTAFSDLFLASGAVINFAAADMTLTHATGSITLAGGPLIQAENTSIQLDPVLSADGKYTGTTIVGTAGATVAFGDLLYLASSGKWLKAKADAASTSGGVLLGFALASSTDTNPILLLLNGNIRADAAFPTFTVGAAEYISGATAGVVTESQPTTTDFVIRVIGFALTADSLMFNPSPDYITHT